MSKIAFIYPGQGAQKLGMGKEFYEKYGSAKTIFDQASKILDLDMVALCFDENEKLDMTEYTQAAMVTTCLAMTAVVEQFGIHPDYTAGLSLGEYAAISVAGGCSAEDAITTVRQRGILMQEAVPTGEGAMAAVLGLNGEAIEEAIKDIEGVSIANYNCPGQIVITGKFNSVKLAEVTLKEAGAKRVIMLNVSGPFHSPMLAEAGHSLKTVLEPVEWKRLQIPYVTNVTGECVMNIEETKNLLAKQVSSPVKWEQSMRNMIANGIDTFVEIGPGKTLTGFLKKIDKTVTVYHIETLKDMEEVISDIKK